VKNLKSIANLKTALAHLEVPQTVKTSFLSLKFANESRIKKTICRLKTTRAQGIDEIPASVLKLGVSVLAAPIARLVNVSLASGVVLRAFKTALIVPVYKGKGKAKCDPASYRLIALLPAMVKILEIVVRDDLDLYLALTGALPDTQYRFRLARSASMALATAEDAWHSSRDLGKTVGIMAFDLTADFDTVGKEQLLQRLHLETACGDDKASLLQHPEGPLAQASRLWPSIFFFLFYCTS
jgi:hypothetical protein